MVDVFRYLGPVCLTTPNVCLYVGNKLKVDENNFEHELSEILHMWAHTPTVNSLGTLTDTFWLGKAWLKAYEKYNTCPLWLDTMELDYDIKHRAEYEKGTDFTNAIKNLLIKLEGSNSINSSMLVHDETLNDIIELKERYKSLTKLI